jgi:hypothetical protein
VAVTYEHVESGRRHVAPEPYETDDAGVAEIWRRNVVKLDAAEQWQRVDDADDDREPGDADDDREPGDADDDREPGDADDDQGDDQGSAGSEPTDAVVRAWALENGVEVSGRGRVGSATLDAYRAAHA